MWPKWSAESGTSMPMIARTCRPRTPSGAAMPLSVISMPVNGCIGHRALLDGLAERDG